MSNSIPKRINIKVNSPNTIKINKTNEQLSTNASTLERTFAVDSFEKKNKKTSKKIFVAGGIIAAAAGIAFAVIRGKTVQLKDIKFDKGIASFYNGKKFSGKIQDKLKNGDKIILEYTDGVLQKSTRKGSKAFNKIFEIVNNEKIVTIYKNGKRTTVNLTKIANEVKTSQDELNKLLKDYPELSLEEFQKQVQVIKHKDKKQIQEIDRIIEGKKDAIAKQKAYERTNKQLGEITFENGRAYLNNKVYCGKVHHQYPNGDKVVLEYNYDGCLIKSEYSGSRNFTKKYNTLSNSVTITENGTSVVVNPKEKARSAIRIAEAEKAKQLQQAKLAQFEEIRRTQIDELKTKLSTLDDNELAGIKKECQEQLNEICQKANAKATTQGIRGDNLYAKLDLLGIQEHKTYDLLSEKISIINKEERLRKFNLLDNLLHKSSDNAVKTLDSRRYGTLDELAELNRYYDDYQCNFHLRNEGGALNINLDLMDSLFKKAPALNEEAVVYRGVSTNYNIGNGKKFIDSIQEGFVIENPAFTSTSTACKDAQFMQFAQGALGGDGVLMRIKLPKGTKGVLGGYNEFLLPRDSKIKVMKLNTINGVKIAECEYILPN